MYKDADQSPYLFRRRNQPIAAYRPETSIDTRNQSPKRSGEESKDGHTPDTPSHLVTQSQQGLARRPRRDGRQGPSSRSGAQQYCSQGCLIGLTRRAPLNKQYPNVSLHRGQDSYRKHPVDHATWLYLLREQLAQTLDNGVVLLGKQGAQGVLFKVSLLTY